MAQKQCIKSLKKLAIASIVAPNDFKLDKQKKVSLAECFEQNLSNITPYCIDWPQREVLFVETLADVDLVACKPFIYEAQRAYGENIIRASFEELHQIVQHQQHKKIAQPIFLYSTGRCGSTLLCNLMGDCSDVVAISEPDYFTQLPFLMQQYNIEAGEELVAVIRNLSVLLVAHLRPRYPDGAAVFKLRSQCTEVAEIIQRAFPDARNIFLYRSVLATVNSFRAVMSRHPLARLASVINCKYLPLLNIIPVRTLNYLPFLRGIIHAIAPLASHNSYNNVGIGTATGVLALAWLSGLDKVLRIQNNNRAFFNAVLRYEELKDRPLEVIAILLEQLGLSPINEQSKQRMLLTLQKDVQKGSELVSSGEYVLKPSDEQLIQRAIQAHEVVNHREYQLPGSIRAPGVDGG